MRIKANVLTISTITLILLAVFAPISINPSTLAQPKATLTGRIFDHGEDTDIDGLFNFLVVEVEVNINEPDLYRIKIEALRDTYYKTVYFYGSTEVYLDVGMHNVSLSFNGIAIYANKINATHAVGVSLIYEEDFTEYAEIIPEIPLSTTYDYIFFDIGANLSGTIYDEGVDTDGDGFFNFLQVGVEVNVTDAAWYQVSVSGLVNVSGYLYYYISVQNTTESFLDIGAQILNVSLHSASIYTSHAINISLVSWISLYIIEDFQYYQLDYKNNVPLNRAYSYEEFETLAYFTGTILDEGVDEDANLKYDYLKITAEINVTEAGNYVIELQNLVDNAFHYIYVYDSVSKYFDVGVYLVNLTIYGPRIYVSQINPMYIEMIRLYTFIGWQTLTLDNFSGVPLSKTYNYADFESHASLTGRITDSGVDTDGDGLYDYLEVEVEVNVTEAGRYEIYVDRLEEKVNSTYYKFLYVPQSVEEYFDVGIHNVSFKYHGPRLAYEHFNPTNISDIRLYEREYPYVQLSYIPDAALSRRYDYTLFNAPLNDMQISLVVYPNGTIGISGTTNSTHMYPPNMGPLVNATLGISTTSETTTGSASGTLVFPEDGSFRWPFHSTTADFALRCDEDMLNASLGATIFMPPEGGTTYPTNASDFSLVSTYADGLLDLRLQGETRIPSYDITFPFNITDLIVLADYVGNELAGNITFRTVSGFPLGDVIVYFNGNKTDLFLTGHVNVTYGNYFGMEINATTLEGMLADFNSTIPGQGPESFYNMTWGLLECTQLNTTKTPWYQGITEAGADIQYNVTIHGNFTGLFARLLAQMLFPYSVEEAYPTVYAALESAFSSLQSASVSIIYYHASGIAVVDLRLASDVKIFWTKALELVPSTVPIQNRTQVDAWLRIANATAYAIKNFSLNASYTSATQKLDLDAWLLANKTQLENDVIPYVPEAVPPELRTIVESYVNTTYCTLTYCNGTVNYVNGTANFEIDWTLQGDFKAQVNHLKRFYIDGLNATSPWMLTWQLRMLDETAIDIGNFEAEAKISQDWMYLTFNGLIAAPPRDDVDFIRFRLSRFFNMTADTWESPREFERLQIEIIGGSNTTHTVLLYAPPTVLGPYTVSLDYKTIVWQNTTLSGLKDLLFQIAYQGVIDYLGNTYYVPIFTNSTVSSFNFNAGAKRISFNVTGTSGAGFCNVTIPRSLLYAALGEWVVKIDGTTLTPGNFTVAENEQYVFLFLNYSHSDHTVEIVGTWVVAEFPPNMLPPILIALSFIAAVIAVKHRKRLGRVKTRYQSVINAFANKLYQLRS